MTKVYDLAFVRSGDKGDLSNVAVLAKDDDAYAQLEQTLVPEAIKKHMGDLVHGAVVVHKLPNLNAFNVVMHEALGGGATRTLRYDSTGKSMCTILSWMNV